jgi:hypothetical protein
MIMGTRSRVGVMHGSKCKSVYIHWDGYLDGVGRILLNHYDSARANHLVALGDVSSLGRNVEIPEGAKHTFDAPVDGITVFYGRDRKESGVEFQVDHDFDEFLHRVDECGAEFYYIMQDGVWYAGSIHDVPGLAKCSLVSLSEALVWKVLSK